MSHYIDLNSDLGESFGNYTLGMDSEVLNHVTSAKCCLWMACWRSSHYGCYSSHVQGKGSSRRGSSWVSLDLMGFGRRAMAVNPAEAKAYMIYQVGALQAFLR